VERFSATEYLRDQYATPDKLDVRLHTHQRFSERPDDFLDWVLDHLDPKPGESVVDVGSAEPRTTSPWCSEACALSWRWTRQPGWSLPATSMQVRMVSRWWRSRQAPSGFQCRRPATTWVWPTMSCSTLRMSLHREASQRLGYQPAGRVIERFNMDHLHLVRSVFPSAERYIRDDVFLFPSADSTLRYYASGMIDAIEDRPVDNGHRQRLLDLVGEGVETIIAREGVFKDPKPAGCFVVTKT
jgi:hypothetical protein